MGKINTGIIGVGNCFAGLFQGIEYYKRTNNTVVGIMHETIGPYSWKDIDFVTAFDVSKHKVGKDITEAQYAKPNMVEYVTDMQNKGVTVNEAPRMDGIGKYVKDMIEPMEQSKSDEELEKEITKEIKDKKVDVLVNYLPVGSEKATKFWAQLALNTGCAFINCMPVFIASDPEWHNKFKQAGLPVIGDDIKSQVGATIIHRGLVKICDDRGAVVKNTYQLNVGGNTDFKNMLERERLISKKVSKQESVQSQLRKRLDEDKIHIGPSDFIPFQKNRKLCFLRIEANSWANAAFNIELRLDVDDKANSAGIAVDAIRLAKLALDRSVGGSIDSASMYLMKHPRIQMSDSEARKKLEEFIVSV